MKILFLLVACQLLSTLPIFSQQTKVIAGKPGMYPSFVSFAADARPKFSKGKLSLTDVNARVTPSVAAKVIREEIETNGIAHYRYQQTINDIPIEDAIYVVHTRRGFIFAQNGKWIKDLPQSLPSTSLTEPAALGYALRFVNAKTYKWQSPKSEALFKEQQNDPAATFYPKGQLVFYSGEQDVTPSALRLAYKFDIYASNPISRQIVFVDAVTGQILGRKELLHSTDKEKPAPYSDSTGEAATVYSGTQTIKTGTKTVFNGWNYDGSMKFKTVYRLLEFGRGKGIATYNLKTLTDIDSAVDFTDDDNIWNNVNGNKDQFATDAHWGAEKTYDFYLEKFGRNSIDNMGYPLRSYVHMAKNLFNAFWDGYNMYYGDGDKTDSFRPLTALDVCGHEISHGLTSYTSNLNYSYESGALNEGFSDIMATAIEFFAGPAKANWTIGEDFHTIRSMSNPKTHAQPDTYKGQNWSNSILDHGGVHTNSGVLNYWYYLLSQGGSGTNDNGFSYTVTGIGIDKATAIAYRTNTVYLTSASQFSDAKGYSIQAAADLYGERSNEVTQTNNAWDAVGVVATTDKPFLCGNNFEPNETIATATEIPLNTDIPANIDTATDKDFYKITTTASQRNLYISLARTGNEILSFFDGRGGYYTVSTPPRGQPYTMTYNSDTAGTYYIRITGKKNANCYTLHVSTNGTKYKLTNPDEYNVHSLLPGIDKPNALIVYPNPVQKRFTVFVYSEKTQHTELSMIDIMGRMLFKQPVQLQKGNNIIPVNMPPLPPGSYVINLTGLRATKVQVLQ